jgi:hypothetical protein
LHEEAVDKRVRPTLSEYFDKGQYKSAARLLFDEHPVEVGISP